MIYEFPITTEITDTASSPKKTVLKLTKGILHQLEIISYVGSRGTLYVALRHGLYQLFPTNPETYFRLAGEPFSFREAYKLYSAPFEFVVYSYLYDADYSHDIRVRVGFLREEDLRGVVVTFPEE